MHDRRLTAARAPQLVAVLAMAENGVIGRDGRLPWRLSGDLRRFKAITLGKPVLMGRRTFESLGKPLPGRANLVLTRDPRWSAPGATAVHSLDKAVAAAGDAPQLMVIGGAEVYALCWPRLSRIELTRVHAHPDGDTFLAGMDWSGWRVVAEERHAADERNEFDYSFLALERPAQA
ncbi:MAG: diacylglycerol kinase [Proteobacteria bacterium]|nr:diacylglycerol kinase [Pseudomonadota bacterium]